MKPFIRSPFVYASLALGLAACGGSSSGGGTADTTPPDSSDISFARYELANGCYAIQNASSKQFLVTSEQGGLRFDDTAADNATPFFFKASALGSYLFYGPSERYMSMTSSAGPIDGLLENLVGESAATASAVGDLVALIGPRSAVEQAIKDGSQQFGDSLLGLIGQVNSNRAFGMVTEPNDGAEWVVDEAANGSKSFVIASKTTNEPLAVVSEQGVDGRFQFVPKLGCAEFPEAKLNATGKPFSGSLADGTVFGYAETHMHLGGSEALGGRIGYGRPFHKFGITHALGDCEEDHGINGTTGILDIAVDSNTTLPMHDTVGWPSYNDWPTYSSQTHHQTYYMWLKRAWMGGLRFMVNHLVANEMLCLVYPLKQHDCNEMESARLQLQVVQDLQDYIDAQSGGPGMGFFRIVTSAAQARSVIEGGKMAVINGTELEKVFDCGEYLDSPECTFEQIDERMDEWYDMGLRAVFPLHIFDNALGGTEIARFTNDPAVMNLYNAGNLLDTGHNYATVPCSEAESIERGEAPTEDRDLFGLVATQLQQGGLIFAGTDITGCQNNARPLTSTGEYLVNRLIDKGILIETDHSGPLARKAILDIALERGVPVLSGHSGSVTHARDSKRILEVGGIISNLSDDPAPVTIKFIQDLEQAYIEVFGSTKGFATGFGSDINGIHHQSAPRDDAAEKPLVYPFRSYAGDVAFERQQTGDRVFDLNSDGVAHYGLYPDYIADIQQTEGGQEALKYLFRSAEAYIQAMEKAETARAKVSAQQAAQ